MCFKDFSLNPNCISAKEKKAWWNQLCSSPWSRFWHYHCRKLLQKYCSSVGTLYVCEMYGFESHYGRDECCVQSSGNIVFNQWHLSQSRPFKRDQQLAEGFTVVNAVLTLLHTVLLKGQQLHSCLLEHYALASFSITNGRGLSATAPLTYFVELPVLCT